MGDQYGRIRVLWWLQARTPLHVGGIGGDEEHDLALAVDGAGRLYVPGTSAAGPMRAWMERAAGAPLPGLWGSADDDGHASLVVVRNALVLPDVGAIAAHAYPSLDEAPGTEGLTELWDGVGIDRVTGTAAHGILYNRQMLPRGTVLRLIMRVDTPDEGTHRLVRARLRALRAAIDAGVIRFGAGKTRGAGRVRVLGAEAVPPLGHAADGLLEHRLDSRRGVLEALGLRPRTAASETPGDPADDGLPHKPRILKATVRWRAARAVMVRASEEGGTMDSLPRTSQDRTAGDAAYRLVLSGASTKGVARTFAERVVRTCIGTAVNGGDAGGPESDDGGIDTEHFLRQLRVPIVERLFGTDAAHDEELDDGAGGGGQDDGVAGGAESTLGSGALGVDPCYSTGLPLALADLRALVAPPAEDGHGPVPRELLERLDTRGLRPETHVAIDRWTGGAAAGALFAVLAPREVAWEPIEFFLDLDRLGVEAGENELPADPAVALFVLVLDALASGKLRLGHAVNRGMGDIEVESITLARLDRAGDPGRTLSDVCGEGRRAALVAAWRRELDAALEPAGRE